MKTKQLFFLIILLSSNSNIAQNVGIGNELFTPDSSAILEIRSEDKGTLISRMTTLQRDLIINPAEGLIIFNVSIGCLEYFFNGQWHSNCGTCPTPVSPTAYTHDTGETQIVWNWNNVAGANGYKWHTTNNYNDATDLGNTTTVIQTGLNVCTVYTIYVWAYNICGNSTVLILNSTTTGNAPTVPTAGIHTPTPTQIVWNWNSVAGANGYKWHTTNNYDDATDLGNTTTVTQIGLTCNTSNTIYVWAYNTCGNSTALTLTQTTVTCPFTCGTSTVTFTYNGSQVTYGTIVRNYGGSVGTKCWLDRNLGASQVATSSTDHLAYGDLFQWGRKADGHQIRTSGVTETLSDKDLPIHSDFIRLGGSPWDWRSNNNTYRWNANPSVTNPCPNGWRVPNDVEWQSEVDSWSSQNPDGAINSPLKLPMAGYRDSNNGYLEEVGTGGLYWSSYVSSNADIRMSQCLRFNNSIVFIVHTYRARGLSVRCIQD